MAAARHPLRSHIIALFRRGELVSVHEATLICDVSRQAISKWIKAEGINIEAHRLAYVAKLRTNATRQLDGKPALRKPTKAQMRKTLEDAMRRFNAANTKPGEPMAGSGRAGTDRSAGGRAKPQME